MQVVKMENGLLEEYCQKLHCFNYISHFNKRQIQISLFWCLILAAFNIKINKLFVGSIAHEVIKHELHNTKKYCFPPWKIYWNKYLSSRV